MNEDEIMQRAREAYIAWYSCPPFMKDEIRLGKYDGHSYISIIAKALRDYHKPMAEILPPDPDDAEMQKLWLKHSNDASCSSERIENFGKACIKRGRELERGEP
jgi:hypothetical protein